MAATMETPAQFDRDLRSAHKGWKRGKDSREKWAHGHRPAAGLKWNPFTGEIPGSETPEVLLSKSRPSKKNSDYVHDSHRKKHANTMKIMRPQPTIFRAANGRPSGRIGARGEIEDPETSRSIVDLLVPAGRKEGGGPLASWGFHSMDGVLYSFDASDTPSRPVTLETFVKANNRTTEKLVEKEYEILDGNGDLLKGRKARSDLRKSASAGGGGVDDDDDDGFELV